MEDSDTDPEGPCLMAIGVDSFRDLLKGNIDIVEYLNSAPASVGGSSENLFDDESRFTLLSKMEASGLLMNAGIGMQLPQHHHQQQQQQQQQLRHQQQQNGQPHLPPPPPPRLHHQAPPTPMMHATTSGIGRSNGGNSATVYGNQHGGGGRHRNSQEGPPSYEQHVMRLPDSPPETDSGAGSAGSPSGSEASPYSPEFQHFHHLQRHAHHLHHHHRVGGHGGHQSQGSVIHPPVLSLQSQQQPVNGGNANGPNPESSMAAASGSQQCRSASDVILNVHGLDHLTQSVVTDYLSVQADGRSSGHTNGHNWSQSNLPECFPMGPPSGGGGNETNSRTMTNGQQPSPHVTTPNPSYTPYVLPALHQSSSYVSDVSSHRKRARTEAGATPIVKPEPNSPTGRASEESLFYDDSFGGHQQTIRFSEFQKEQWFTLCNTNGREMQQLGFAVVADKGFNYSHFDTAFVNQKKNHFQVSVHIEVRDSLPPKFVRVPSENGGILKPISEFQLDFFGVKAELLSSYVPIKQSQTDRKPIGYEPVKLDLPPNRVTKVTVARLHFSETTMNNQRKNGRPNPDQKYFYLVASLNAVVQGNEKYTIAAYNSERVIVRASNPGQFDNGDSDVHWQKGQSPGSIFHPGPVGIGTDKPSTALSVTGDISCTGTVFHPSDARLKQNIQEVNCAEALSKLSQIRVVQYEIRPEIADQWGLSEEERQRIGVIAQELEDVIPDAVRENGDYLTVDDNRIFYESAAAVKELCRLTGNLEYKIEEVEKISKKLSRLSYLRRLGSLRSSDSVNTCNSSKPADSACAGSYFSCSQSSIATSTPPTTKRDKSPTKKDRKVDESGEDVKFRGSSNRKHRHHHHHCACRRFSFGDRRGPCSNRIIQSTIIILVIVMAFCLLSMATLYILDWHKRNTAPSVMSTNGVFGTRQQLDLTSTVGSTGGGKSGGAGVAPGLMAVTPKSGRSRTPAPYNPFALHPPPYKQPNPLHSSCDKLPCLEFCCPNSYTYYAIDGNAVDEAPDSSDQTIVITAEQRQDAGTWNLPPVGTNFNDKLLNMVNTKLKQFRQRETQSQSHSSLETRIQKRRVKLVSTPPTTGHSTPANDFLAWRVYDAPHSIKITSLNASIDSRYCLENTCSDSKRGNFTYYIPVSKYMPHIPLEVEFGIENMQFVQYCAKWTGEYCYGVEEAYKDTDAEISVTTRKNSDASMDVQKKQTDLWELPVGMYQTSTYRFRIGTSTTHIDRAKWM